MSKAFMAHSIKEKLAIEIMGKSKDLEVSDIADGCVGVSLWFDSLENAVAWAGKDTKISEAELIKPTDKENK